MIKRIIDIDSYWKVIAYYNIDYNFFSIIAKDLRKINCREAIIDEVYTNMYNHYAKAVTISSIKYNISIVLFNTHKHYDDYVNSIIHEAEHIKQSMLYAYNVKDEGEAPAYTVGYVATQLLKFIF